MSVPLRLLLVEDNENDAVLIVRELTRGGYEIAHERVCDAGSMRAALDRQSWDLVLSDHSMPQFSGRAALQVLRERHPDVPFIFVSGTIGEDAAVEAMRMGAQDYLSKSNLRRLVPAIQRELREAEGRRERHRAEAALRESEHRFEKVFQASPVGITISTLTEGRYLDVNAAFLRMIGRTREEVVGHTAFDIEFWRDPADRARIMERLRSSGGAAQEIETTVQAKDGALRHVLVALEQVDFSGVPCVVALVHDVTGPKLLEQQLNQAQKMEAVGRLAGGVAHDFNNMLTVITSYGDLLLGDLEAGDRRRDDIEEILKAARGAATLTRQLLAFSRQEVIQPRPISVNAIVAGTEKMLKRVIGEDVELAADLAAEPSTVMCDPGQLEQIVMNLVVNARDAMPEGGKLRIATTAASLDESMLHEHALARPGRYVVLEVRDTGIGMDAATRDHIFEPFFTTKEQGKGTGLGLATVYAIAKQVGGFVWVDSAPGQGSSFRVFFPSIDAPPSAVEQNSAAELPRGTETVLLVEDATAVRTVIRQVLERLGYSVLDAADGQLALEVAARHHGPIDLVVTDIVMPALGGRELAERLRRVRPDIRILYTSGYTDDAVVRTGVLDAQFVFMQKPFTPETLASKVREALA
jgi:two-component system cell cycle sensor histidine kinase/response regulator CckA